MWYQCNKDLISFEGSVSCCFTIHIVKLYRDSKYAMSYRWILFLNVKVIMEQLQPAKVTSRIFVTYLTVFLHKTTVPILPGKHSVAITDTRMALTSRHVGETQQRLGRTTDRAGIAEAKARSRFSPPGYWGVPCLSPKREHSALTLLCQLLSQTLNCELTFLLHIETFFHFFCLFVFYGYRNWSEPKERFFPPLCCRDKDRAGSRLCGKPGQCLSSPDEGGELGAGGSVTRRSEENRAYWGEAPPATAPAPSPCVSWWVHMHSPVYTKAN